LGTGQLCWLARKRVRLNTCRQLVCKIADLSLSSLLQLQRIRNPKHEETIKSVIEDTVELFGINFQVTMETVFTTLEHTARMIETTGENRDFKRSDPPPRDSIAVVPAGGSVLWRRQSAHDKDASTDICADCAEHLVFAETVLEKAGLVHCGSRC
jgi:hypothetical protein